MKTARRRLAEAKLSVYAAQVPGMGGGNIVYKPGRNVTGGRHKRAIASYGVTLSAGKIYDDPRHHIARMINSALTKPPRSSIVTVYDAAGKPIATIDPHTRQRKSIP